MYSLVTDGELRSLSRRWEWERSRLDDLAFAKSQFDRIDISHETTIEAYGVIDFTCRKRGLKLSKNDLWIAATACSNQAILVTFDKDFIPLASEFFELRFVDESS
jgi:predicted nucleic acid-binding protein